LAFLGHPDDTRKRHPLLTPRSAVEEQVFTPTIWNAVFERTTQDWYVIDGPMVVVVNDRTGDVCLYE
jgi:hypothetical protein